MTADNFTETAHAAAREYARTPRMNVGTVQDRIAEAHAAGWEAARTNLAALEPTDVPDYVTGTPSMFDEVPEADSDDDIDEHPVYLEADA